MADKMIAYCGLDCSKCDAYTATQSGDAEKLIQLAKQWSAEPQQIVCDGCKSGKRKSSYCKNSCKVRVCCLKKAIDSCVKCDDFPCSNVESVLKNNPEAEQNLKEASNLVSI